MKRVQVYYNIRRGDYSVRQSGRVIDHVERIVLRDVRFNVAPAGRDKVRATGVKNVHATVSGYIVSKKSSPWHVRAGFRLLRDDLYERATKWNSLDFVSYNPFKYDQFVKITSNGYDGFYADPVHSADYVALMPNREIRTLAVK